MDYFDLCKNISSRVKSELVNRLSKTGFIGESISNPNSLKSTHEIDNIAIKIIKDVLKDFNCNIFMESAVSGVKKDADFSVFIDPVDGSLNWDRGVGDPCIVIAISDKSKEIRFRDLLYAYVEGFRSGDIYYTRGDSSYFISKLTNKEVKIICKGNSKLSEATAYLRPGYDLAKNQFEGSFPVFLLCKDIRAIDNTGMEICEIARNAADIMVETRKMSDFFNLMAFPILRNAGGIICDLNGNRLDNQLMDVDKQYDYIACNNQKLLDETLKILGEFKKSRKFTKENIKFEF